MPRAKHQNRARKIAQRFGKTVPGNGLFRAG
jgi:hypothetical protein